MLRPKFLVLSGEGINCERETAQAFEAVSATAQIVHLSEVIKKPKMIFDFQGLVFPGGFSYGDELGSGQVLTLKIKATFYHELCEAVHRGLAILGVCNGFQVLSRLGLLEDETNLKKEIRTLSLIHNEQGHFIDRQVTLNLHQSPCWWTRGIQKTQLSLPIRHGEGRLVFSSPMSLEEVRKNHRIVFSYTENVNGSIDRIAGLTNKKGNILGLMPHPEAGFYRFQHEVRAQDPLSHSDGAMIFKSIVETLNSK